MKKLLMVLLLFMGLNAAGQSLQVRATYFYPGDGSQGNYVATGERINRQKLYNEEYRWVALSPDVFKKLGVKLNDVIEVKSSKNPRMNGRWIVKDKMARRIQNGIDFLLPPRNSYKFENGPVTITKCS